MNTLGEFLLLFIALQAMPLLSLGMHLFSALKEIMGNKTRRLGFTFLEELEKAISSCKDEDTCATGREGVSEWPLL